MRYIIISALLLTGFWVFAASPAVSANPQEIAKKITWLGQSSVRIEAGGKIIYTDPYFIATPEKADIILITYHNDHNGRAVLERLGPPKALFAGFEIEGGTKMVAGDSVTVDGVTIRAVPAYTVSKSSKTKTVHGVGFLITVEGVTIYIPGYTERIPEMKDIKCDIAFMPMGQRYTMKSVDDAIQSALDVGAAIAFPYNWGMTEGKEADALKFVDALKSKGVKASMMALK